MQKKLFLLIIISIFSISIKAQTLVFDKEYIDCIDKWVAISAKADEFILGFVYFDEQAGLTLDFGGTFKISETGEFVLENNDDMPPFKLRLDPQRSRASVAIIPENKFEELKIKAEPDWLKTYKENSNTTEYLYSKGYLYNAWGRCELALDYLEEANKINKEYNLALITELAYSYNCLEQYDKVPEIIHSDTKSAYALKELIYAQIHLGALETAGESCLNYIKNADNKEYAAENFYNLLSQYYQNKDKKNFDYWLKYAKKWAKDTKISNVNEVILRNIKIMEQEMKSVK